MREWFEHPTLLLILIVINLPVYKIFMDVFLGNFDGFKESVWYGFIPDIISAFKGEFWDDQWAEIKLAYYLALCILTVLAEYTAISKFIVWLHA